MPGYGNAGQAIGDRLAGPGAGLDHGNRRLSIPMPLFIQFDATEQLGHLGDHQPLAVTRLQRLVFEEGTVGRLDLGLEVIVEHAVSGAEQG